MPLETYVAPLIQLCQQAGAAICGHYHSSVDSQLDSKSDNSPLTQADIDSHHILLQGLQALTPELPVLSEESPAKFVQQRQQWPRYWLVDPLDGTKEFINRTGEFTINIALIDKQQPVLGVIYLPLEQKAYVGLPGTGAWLYQHNEARALSCRALQAQQPLTVLASYRHKGERLQQCLDWLQQSWGSVQRSNSGSALKFCQLASGEGDFYPRYAPCCEWDVAAGHALVVAAGGAVVGMDGKSLRYNCREDLISPHFHAIADPAHLLWQSL